MAFIAVGSYDSKSKVCACFYITDNYEARPMSAVKLDSLGIYARTNNLTPVNFSINRDDSVRMDCGDFARFSELGSAVVLAELKSRGGKTLGYRLLSCSQGVVVNLKTADIVKREESYGENNHFLQNGIVRNNAVSCFPRHPFPEVVVENGAKRHKKPVVAHNQSKPVENSVSQRPSVEPKKPMKFNDNQKAELEKCKKNGIDPKLIQDPNLNQQQMRVLWVSKSKGALAEEFNNPQLSSDAMKFYADRLYDKQTVEDCKLMLKHPELGVDELSELYQCACEGIDYSNFIGKSATDIGVAREMASREYWGSSSKFDTDYYQKAMNVAMKIKGF